jgi:hypothetical protein
VGEWDFRWMSVDVGFLIDFEGPPISRGIDK